MFCQATTLETLFVVLLGNNSGCLHVLPGFGIRSAIPGPDTRVHRTRRGSLRTSLHHPPVLLLHGLAQGKVVTSIRTVNLATSLCTLCDCVNDFIDVDSEAAFDRDTYPLSRHAISYRVTNVPSSPMRSMIH